MVGKDHLRVELLSEGGAPLVREVSTRGAACEALAETVALIADAWSRELPWRDHRLNAPQAQHKDANNPDGDLSTVLEPGRTAGSPPTSLTTPSTGGIDRQESSTPPVPPPPPSETAKPAPEAAIAGEPPTSSGPPAFSPAPSAGRKAELEHGAEISSWETVISLELLGGTAVLVDPGPAWSAVGALGVDLSISPRFGVGAQGGISSTNTISSTFGSVSLLRFPIAMFARYDLHEPEESGLSIRGGLALDVLHARSRGFTQDGTTTVAAPGLYAALRAQWRASERLGLFLELAETLVFLRDSFQVDPLGEVASAPRLMTRAGGGLAVHFF
jgi:hypothetical protein